MELKDWKKNGFNQWQNKKDEDKWINISKKEKDIFVVITPFLGYKEYPNCNSFKTKSQALKFAKEYMRTH